MTEKKGKGAEVPEPTEEEGLLIDEAQAAAAQKMGAEVTDQAETEQCDPEVLARSKKILESHPEKIEKLQAELREAGIYVGKFSKRDRQLTLAEAVAGLHSAVKEDLKQRDDITDKVAKAVKAVTSEKKGKAA